MRQATVSLVLFLYDYSSRKVSHFFYKAVAVAFFEDSFFEILIVRCVIFFENNH